MKQAKFKVHAHALPTPTQLEAPNSGSSVSGSLYIDVDERCFPGEGWHDYVTPVLCWWVENAMHLYLPNSEVKSICMDGEYAFSMRRSPESDDVVLTLREHPRSIAEEYVISYKRCLATFRGAAKCVLNELKGLGLEKRGEASGLRSSLEQLERLESEIKAHGLP